MTSKLAKKSVLFVIHDLSVGGAEKVLINLVNHMDQEKFDITVLSLFGGGVNEQFLNKNIRLIIGHRKAIPANSYIMKLFSPQRLFKYYIKDKYDIIVSYLEGPSARIVSGCPNNGTKLVSWIHSLQHTTKEACRSFRSPSEAKKCYFRFDETIGVSKFVAEDFQRLFQLKKPMRVLYNAVESDMIRLKSTEKIDPIKFNSNEINLIGVGKVVQNKGFDRLARIHVKLRKFGYPVHTYILGVGPQRSEIEKYIKTSGEESSFTFLGYETNPYKYVAKADLFVCSSFSEGFSTAATEALIVGTPVCTVEVSGMKEMLGENNEYGMVVENNEDSLLNGIKMFLDDAELLKHYKEQAIIRGSIFETDTTVKAVEEMLLTLK